MSRSILFHVQHLLGIGHLQRSLRIANALGELNAARELAARRAIPQLEETRS